MAIISLEDMKQLIERTDMSLEDLLGSLHRIASDLEKKVEELKKGQPPIIVPSSLSTLRLTSKNNNFPYTWKTVPFIQITTNGLLLVAQAPKEKLKLLSSYNKDHTLLAVWPGDWKSDVFLVDDLNIARVALNSAI